MLSAPDSENAPILEDLQARGLEIPDRPAALSFLRRVGAHRAWAYSHPLLAGPVGAEGARFVSGASFRHVAALYDFDKSLRFLTLEALEEIEIAVRADVVRRLAAKGGWAHRDPKLFVNSKNFNHQEWLRRCDKAEQHYNHKRRQGRTQVCVAGKEPMPIWESAEQWSFGMLSLLFAGMEFPDRRAVARHYKDRNGTFTASALQVMSGVRNVAAHHGWLWNTSALTLQPKSGRPKPGKQEEVFDFNAPKSCDARKRAHAFLCVIAHFIRCVRPDGDWRGRLRELILKEFPADAPGLSAAQMGFPSGWERHPFWREPAPVGD